MGVAHRLDGCRYATSQHDENLPHHAFFLLLTHGSPVPMALHDRTVGPVRTLYV